MANKEPDLSLVRRLKAKGRHEEAIHQLSVWLEGDPTNPILLYEMALALDNQGRESEAIPYYQNALKAGMDPMHQLHAIIGLGSSLRVVGRLAESHQVLEDGLNQYPGDDALRVFLSLTEERMGNYGDAIGLLLDVIVHSGQSDQLALYRPAIRHYRQARHDVHPGTVEPTP